MGFSRFRKPSKLDHRRLVVFLNVLAGTGDGQFVQELEEVDA